METTAQWQEPLSIGKKLKAFTAAHHDKIEQNPLTRAVAEGSITETDYKHLLSKFYGFYAACEPPLLRTALWQQAGFDAAARRKTPLLARDLAFFGINAEELPLCSDLPPLQTDAQRLGFLYVTEGSTLGGQILGRALAKKFGFTAEHGAAYFNGYGAENLGRMWKEVQLLLENFHRRHPQTESELLAAARQTFEKLDAWLGAVTQQ